MRFIERIYLAWNITKHFGIIDEVIVKIEVLGSVIQRLEAFQTTMPAPSILEALVSRLDSLEKIVRKIEAPAENKPSVQPEKAVHPAKEDLHEWDRLKLLSKFVQLSGQAQAIEQEWQRIQQDEHDFQFAFQTSANEDTQGKYLYKKGIADGIKWCINRFS